MNRYRIASNRMSWCDYDIGWFFVTICTNDKIHYFGKIVDGVMVLNDMGKIVYDEIIHIPNHRKNIRIDEFVVIPNHIHMIIIIDDCPRRDVLTKRLYDPQNNNNLQNNHQFFSQISPQTHSLGNVIKLFKGYVTKRIKQLYVSSFHRQSNYYEHMIRDERGLQAIRTYIQTNPQIWHMDRNNNQ